MLLIKIYMELIRQSNLILLIFFSSILIYPVSIHAQFNSDSTLRVLLTIAHPDDDALYSGAVYRLTHDLNAEVDLVVVTNGEGGYKYSTLSNEIYGIELDKEEIGREFLPAIRKRELMAGGFIVGIRNFYFIDEQDKEYTLSLEEVYESHWDTTWVKKQFKHILQRKNYDIVITMLVTEGTHGHHKAAALLMMQSVKDMEKSKRPIVLSATIYSDKSNGSNTYEGYADYSCTKPLHNEAYVEFDRLQSFGYNNRLNYQIISNWVIAEHKSQGTMQLLMNRGEIERYWYLSINKELYFDDVKRLFEKISPQQ